MHNRIYIATMGLFTGAISLATILGPTQNISILENRILQDFPNFTFASYLSGEYQNSLEKALGDQFIYREKIITVHENTKGKFMNIFDPITNVDWNVEVVGNKYLWSNDEYDGFFTGFEDSLGPETFIESKYSTLVNNSEQFQKIVNTETDVFFFAPASPVDFANYVIHGETRADYGVQVLKDNMSGNITFIDANLDYNDYPKYFYKTDHHLNVNGQLWHNNKLVSSFTKAGYKMDPLVKFGEIVHADGLKSRGSLNPSGYSGSIYDEVMFYGTEFVNRERVFLDVTWPERCNDQDNPDYIKGYNILSNPDFNLGESDYYTYLYGCNIARRNFEFYDNSDKPNLLVMGDSHFTPINIYFSSNFNKTISIHSGFYQDNIANLITEEDIDVVLIDLRSTYYDKNLNW